MSAEPMQGLADWLAHNEQSTSKPPLAPVSAGAFFERPTGRFLHFCPFADFMIIGEHSDRFIDCRCYHSREVLDAQDRKAVEIDARRG